MIWIDFIFANNNSINQIKYIIFVKKNKSNTLLSIKQKRNSTKNKKRN